MKITKFTHNLQTCYLPEIGFNMLKQKGLTMHKIKTFDKKVQFEQITVKQWKSQLNSYINLKQLKNEIKKYGIKTISMSQSELMNNEQQNRQNKVLTKEINKLSCKTGKAKTGINYEIFENIGTTSWKKAKDNNYL